MCNKHQLENQLPLICELVVPFHPNLPPGVFYPTLLSILFISVALNFAVLRLNNFETKYSGSGLSLTARKLHTELNCQ